MARRARNESGPGTYHVFSRGNRGDPIFLDDLDHQSFLVGLAGTRDENGWRLLSWCLMRNHFHLLLETPRANLGRGMRWLLSGYARAFNERHGLANHLFGDRFGATAITDPDHLRAAARYVARNPVKAGLAERPQDWRWSSWPLRPRRPWDPVDRLTDDAGLLEPFGGCADLYAAYVSRDPAAATTTPYAA